MVDRELLWVERELLWVERELLVVERELLVVERELLGVERGLLWVERELLVVERGLLGVERELLVVERELGRLRVDRCGARGWSGCAILGLGGEAEGRCAVSEAVCGKCGGKMVYNVPRLSEAGGWVHKVTGSFECGTFTPPSLYIYPQDFDTVKPRDREINDKMEDGRGDVTR